MELLCKWYCDGEDTNAFLDAIEVYLTVMEMEQILKGQWDHKDAAGNDGACITGNDGTTVKMDGAQYRKGLQEMIHGQMEDGAWKYSVLRGNDGATVKICRWCKDRKDHRSCDGADTHIKYINRPIIPNCNNCANGGVKIEAGVDDNGNGQLILMK